MSDIHDRYHIVQQAENRLFEILQNHEVLKAGKNYDLFLDCMIRQLHRLRHLSLQAHTTLSLDSDLDTLFNTLTYGERMAVIGRELSSNAKYIVRRERHPEDPDSPGDLA